MDGIAGVEAKRKQLRNLSTEGKNAGGAQAEDARRQAEEELRREEARVRKEDAQRSAERRSHSSFFCAAAAGAAAAASWFARARASTAFNLRLSRSRPT